MTQIYSDPSRESDPHALPDVEVFYINADEAQRIQWYGPDSEPVGERGWYYWFCFPGCLPDSDTIGPFATAAEARADAQGQA